MVLNQNLAHTNDLSSLMFYSTNIVIISHMICHVTILLKVVGYWPIGGRFKKRNRAKTFFYFILNISNTSRLNHRPLHLSKKLWGKTSFKMPKFNLELSKNLILNFAYIHSKRRKLGMFIFFQKYQFVSRNNVNSPPIRQFPSFVIFGHVTCHVTRIER